MKLNPVIVHPGTNTKRAATSPEIICPFGVRAGSLLGVPDTHQEHQPGEHGREAFQHVLSLELPRRYGYWFVRKLWIKQ
jgi:hypothetical protein